jgi:hypothetical protein
VTGLSAVTIGDHAVVTEHTPPELAFDLGFVAQSMGKTPRAAVTSSSL